MVSKWTLMSSTHPKDIDLLIARSSHTVDIVKNKLFIFGGENEPRVPIDNNMLIFDIVSNNWSVHAEASQDVPTPRLGHSSCALGNKLYIFGGRESESMGESSLNDLYSFDVDHNKWSKINPENETRPDKRSFQSMSALDNKLYVFGGCSIDHGRLNDLFEFDLTHNKWTQLSSNDEILQRGGTSLNAFENLEEKCLYLTGGFCGHELDDCWKYDIKQNVWTKNSNLPRHLSVFASASVLDNDKVRLIVHGGEIDPSTLGHNGAGEFSQSTYVFDGSDWKILEFDDHDPKPTSRGWHAASYSNGSFYVYGGNLENNQRTNELWRLDLN